MGLIRFRKELIHIGYSQEYKWQLRPVRYSTLGRAETIKLAAQDSGITESQLEQAFDAFAHEIEQLLCNGHSLELGELGKLYLNIKAKAVRTAENLSADLIRYCHLMLTPTKQFKEEMKQIKHIIEPVPGYYITHRCPFNGDDPRSPQQGGLRNIRVVRADDVPMMFEELANLRLNGTIVPEIDGSAQANTTVTFKGPGNTFIDFEWTPETGYLNMVDHSKGGSDFTITGMGSSYGGF